MTKLFVLADDLTGALDTAVQFAEQGISTCVVTDENLNVADVSILVMSIPTRHMSAEQAYQAVYCASRRAVEAGIPFLYKKTDSVLRGNIGAELTAMMDAAGEKRLDFLPAFPALERTTLNGVQLVNDRPIHESVFKSDPFQPVKHSYIPDIIAEQSSVECRVVRKGESVPDASEKCVCVYDAQTDEDLYEAAQRIKRERGLHVMAGCAGLAGVLAGVIGLTGEKAPPCAPQSRLFVVCGSVNPITRGQLEYAQRNGFARITLTGEQKLDRESMNDELIDSIMRRYNTGKPLILDVNGSSTEKPEDMTSIRERIAENLGYLVKRLWESGLRATIMATGGDTLLAVLAAMGLSAIRPIREMQPGVVLSECMCGTQLVPIISKAGGFGGEKLLTEIADELSNGGSI